MKSFRLRLTLALLALAMIAVTIPAHAQTFSVLYNFSTSGGGPCYPGTGAAIAQGRDGTLYSAAYACGAIGYGAMFNITPSGTLTTPYSFDSTDATPRSGLTLANDGNFYGTTSGEGTITAGTVYKLTPGGTVTILHTFARSDGSQPFAPPIQGTDGNFYGTTSGGGTNNVGTVYKLIPSGTLTTLYSFGGANGATPCAPLVQGADGNFYGTTYYGGVNGFGAIYKISPAGKYTLLYSFTGVSPDGAHPDYAALVQGTDGDFYGTTFLGGGPTNGGIVFKITAAGALTVLHEFNGTDGSSPTAGLVQATDGNFYGTTPAGGSANIGVIFKITPAGTYSVVYNFDGTTGKSPNVALVQHANGILYGDTTMGGTGTNNAGVFYSLNIGATPFVRLVPSSAKVGRTVEILGQGFTGTTGVSFNGTAATFHVSSDTYLTTTVPAGAKTGYISVVTPGGTLKSNKTFRVTPQITSFNPSSGPVGTSVIIMGVSLTGATKVTFGGVKATAFTVNSDTQVTATVPTAAVTGKIAIITAGGTATNATSFTVTP